MTGSKTFLTARDIRVEFGPQNAPVRAVNGVSFTIHEGEGVGIVGESGSGKSTLARVLLGLQPSAARVSGGIEVKGKQYNSQTVAELRGRSVAMVFQDPLSYLDPLMRIGDQIGEVVRLHDADAKGSQASKARVAELLTLVQLKPEHARSYPHELSGGMRQRVLIAIALACRPQLLIADEPTTALDVTTQREILDLIASIRKEFGMALLLISHDLGIISSQCDTVHVMLKGDMIESGSASELFSNPKHSYTQTLLAASKGDDVEPLAPIGNPNASPLLTVRDVNKTFHLPKGGRLDVLKDVNIELKPGETLALVGESGSGKSTLARAILSLLRPDRGDISVKGRSLTSMSKEELRTARTAMYPVFQDSSAAFNPRRTVHDLLSQALVCAGVPEAKHTAAVVEALEQVRLSPGKSFLHRYPHELSGGQRQRLAIARALATGAELVVADEPLSGADVSTRGKVLELLRHLQETKNIAYVFITHDMWLAKTFAHRIAVIYKGVIVEQGNAADVCANPQHDYTKKLLASVHWGN